MKRLILILLLLTGITSAEQFVEHGGKKLLSFDVPEVEYQGKREGKLTRMFFSNPVGNGNLKITVKAKGWYSELKANQRYQDDRKDKRRSQYHRLRDQVEIPGALKTLTYSTTSPYIGEAIVIYTETFRCELLVTGTEEAGELVEPTYQKLLETLKIVKKKKIGELKVGK